MSGADEWNRAMDAIERAAAKRARKAAKREEDARRTAEGRERGAVYWAWRMCCDAGMGESGRICARLPQPSGGLAWFYPVHRRGYWDLAGFVEHDDARARFYTPRWRARLVARRLGRATADAARDA